MKELRIDEGLVVNLVQDVSSRRIISLSEAWIVCMRRVIPS